MTEEEKIETFRKELDYIKDSKIKDLAEKCLAEVPDYFFEMSASTTGKYHPSYALGEGGLVRHTKAAVRLAHEMLQLEFYSKIAESHDQIITALILHDSIKKGSGKANWTMIKHPLYASGFVKRIAAKYHILDDFVIDICMLIESHMGQWNHNDILPKPKTIEQKFVHLCDFLASRKFLEVNFECE